jgi:hypothetical protein
MIANTAKFSPPTFHLLGKTSLVVYLVIEISDEKVNHVAKLFFFAAKCIGMFLGSGLGLSLYVSKGYHKE